jgi:signal transduction histidine kinase
MGNPDEQQVKELESVRALLQDVIGEMRAYAQELRPPVLFNFGLRRAIQSHLEGFQEKHPELHIQLEVDWTGDLLPEQISIALFRVYQESLNNIIKHARARQVWVHLARKENQATMLVQDDGAGFILPADLSHLAREGHLGLVGIRERVEAIGGSLQLDSEPGKGTKIQVEVPLR